MQFVRPTNRIDSRRPSHNPDKPKHLSTIQARSLGGKILTSKEDIQEIRKLIDHMQSGLVELFEQLRELRRRLDFPDITHTDESSPAIVPLFTRVSSTSRPSKDTEESSESIQLDEQPEETHESASMDSPEVDEDQPEGTSDSYTTKPNSESDVPVEPDSETSIAAGDGTPALGTASVGRLLDPIAHELKTGHATADVIAEYVKTARDDLAAKGSLDDRVARDMDVVLRFLSARGKKEIRSEERANILKRIDRWKTYLE